MNKRTSKAFRIGDSIGIVLPMDWVRGNEVKPGDHLEIEYDGRVSVRAPSKTEGETDG